MTADCPAGQHMRAETAEIPASVARLLALSAGQIAEAGASLRDLDPRLVVTVARGSSDNVASLFKYACEITAGIPVASVGPSIASIYGRSLRLEGAALLTVSQAGRSPDLLASLAAARAGGARSIGLVNKEGSPVMRAVDIAVPIHAGRELSVAATKSFVASAVAALAVLAAWQGDAALGEALNRLPEALEAALAVDPTPAVAALRQASSIYVLGRGPGFAMAQEASLKFKETCGIHAESFSSAEFHHGPASLVAGSFPVVAFLTEDEAGPGIRETIGTLAGRGANVLPLGFGSDALLRVPDPGHRLTQPVVLIAAFYRIALELALARGLDPDRPPFLLKATDTV